MTDQIIGVQFFDDFLGRYSPKGYPYYCPFPVEVGDIVLVPMTNNPPVRCVKVCELNIDPKTIHPNKLKGLRTAIRERGKS